MSEASKQKAAALASEFEGFRNYPYQDPVGIWTIGFGSTRDANGQPITSATPPITLQTALTWLQRDMAAAFATIAAEVKVPLTDDEKAAIADLIYNIGAGNFASSTLLRMLNEKDYSGATAQFDRWDMAGGRVLAGLLRRREAETVLFEQGIKEA
ncbi:MAG: lysozyme [Pseudomonadota bacterium]|nr:lysozyme [Pseudomonadota bacterium]